MPADIAAIGPCDFVPGVAGHACDAADRAADVAEQKGVDVDVPGPVDEFLNPWEGLAKGLADAFGWFLKSAYEVVFEQLQPPFGSQAFMTTYGLSMALGAVLCLGVLVWTVTRAGLAGRWTEQLASAGRALLLVPFVVTITPFALWGLTKATHQLSEPLMAGTLKEVTKTSRQLTEGLTSAIGVEGAFPVIIVGLLGVLAAVLLFLEFLFRANALLLAGILAPVVFAGLVNRSLWTYVRKWSGVVFALLIIEPLTTAGLGLGIRMGAEHDDLLQVAQSVALLLTVVLVSGAMLFLIPEGGDALAAASSQRRQLQNAGPMSYVPNPSQVSQASMQKHLTSGRGGGGRHAAPRGGSGGGKAAAAGQAAAASKAHPVAAAAHMGGQAASKTAGAVTSRATGQTNPYTTPKSNGGSK